MKLREAPVLTVIAQASQYAIRILAIWIFMRGHQEPGGGFIAGLVFAAGLALQGIAFGYDAAEKVFPVPIPVLLGSGLAISLSTVLVPVLLGHPFMKSAYGYLEVPILHSHVEWATAALFDLGVFLVVAGSAKSILLHIAEEKSEDVHAPGEAEAGARSGGAS